MPEVLALLAQSVVICGSTVVGGAFLAAALSKMTDIQGAVVEVLDYGLVPVALAQPLTGLFIVANAATALGLLLLQPLAAWTAACLLGIYSIAAATALSRGLHIDCHCGPGSEPLTKATIVRNIALIVAVLPGLVWRQGMPDRLEAPMVAGVIVAIILTGSAFQHLQLRGAA